MTPEEIATEIIAGRAGRMFYYHRSNNPQYRQDEIDEIAAALASYGDARAAAERARCIALVPLVGTAHTYSDMEHANGFAAADTVTRIVAVLEGT